jgi:hypothetical protein
VNFATLRASGKKPPKGDNMTCKTFASALLGAPILALALTAAHAPALAQGAKPKAAKAPTSVTLTNARAVSLTMAEIVLSDGSHVVARITKPLEPGKSVTLKLNKPKGCAYVVNGGFEDESEVDTGVIDLCKESKIRLVE